MLGHLSTSLGGPLLGAPLAIEHIGARHLVLTRAHQGELHLVLNVLDMDRSAGRHSTQQRHYDLLGELLRHLPNAGACCPLTALDREKGLGQGDRNLLGLKSDDRAVATDHFEVTHLARQSVLTVAEFHGTGGQARLCLG